MFMGKNNAELLLDWKALELLSSSVAKHLTWNALASDGRQATKVNNFEPALRKWMDDHEREWSLGVDGIAINVILSLSMALPHC